MRYNRMIMEKEAPNLVGYENFKFNLAESSVRDRSLTELGINLDGLELPYGHHFGDPRLRACIAKISGPDLTPDDIIVTVGAAGALFLIATCMLEKGDRMVVAFPNYATNYETPTAIGCNVVRLEQTLDEGFKVDIDKLESLVTPGTKYFSLTCPHNPSGVMITLDEIKEIIKIAEKKDCYMVFDETYREMSYAEPLPVAASLSDRVISVSSMSKMYGIPGIRVGWLTCKNKALMDHFIAAKEQINITGSVVDEEIAYQTLLKHDVLFPQIRGEIGEAYKLFKKWIAKEKKLEWVEPQGGVTAFPRINVELKPNMELFYKVLLNKYGTFVGPGRWFLMPENYMRIGFAWNRLDATAKGLEGISAALAEVI